MNEFKTDYFDILASILSELRQIHGVLHVIAHQLEGVQGVTVDETPTPGRTRTELEELGGRG